jgi:hypothetical protein
MHCLSVLIMRRMTLLFTGVAEQQQQVLCGCVQEVFSCFFWLHG